MKRLLFFVSIIGFMLALMSCTGDAKVTITFDSNGGNEIETIEVNTNQTSLNLPTPTRAGYTFDGWYLDEALTQPFTIGALLTNQQLTLYAKWIENVVSYTITFESNGGSAVAAITQAAGSSVTQPAAPTKEGYTFGGWYENQALTTPYVFTTMPAQNITLYAKWDFVVVNSTISFESNGGTSVTPITQPPATAVFAPVAPTRTGYTFNGWYSDAGLATVYTFSTMPAQNMTLYAKWTINQYTITFNSNGGSSVTAMTQNFGTAVTAPANPTREGYTFDGWYANAELTTAYTFNTMPAQNITLYAKWTINSYTMTFDSNGGSSVTAMTQNYGTAVTAPANPTKEGYTFDGWYANAELTTAYTFNTMPAQNITLYAKWTINPYTITFNSNGGSSVTDITQNYGTAVTAPAAPNREGYTFDGWFSNAELTTAYTFTTMPAQNITLYAKWTINSYTMTFDSNGGSSVTAMTQNYGTVVTAPAAPNREGYTFDGWFSNAELTTAYTFTTMPAQNMTLYAKWEILIVYDNISDILMSNPSHVKVRGVIYYKYPSPMNPGFYLYDGTGYIYVLSSTDLAVGQGIEFEADFSYFEYTPQLSNLTHVSENSSFTTLPTYIETDLTDIAHASPTDLSYYGLPVIVDGVIYQQGMQYFIMGNFSEEPVFINFKSIQGIMPDPFLAKVGMRIQMHAVVHAYSPMQEAWHILYQPSSPIVDVILTDQQKVAELLAMGVQELDGKAFFSVETLELPSTDPFYQSIITFETLGDNALYFDVETGHFMPTDIMRDITIRVTVKVGEYQDFVDVTIHLKPYETMTIAEFKLLSDMSYGIVSGVVLFSMQDIGLMIIADETGLLAIMSNTMPDYADLIVAGGYAFSMDGLVVMGDELGNTLLDILDHNVIIPVDPVEMSLADYVLLNPNLSSHWVLYTKLTGELHFNDQNQMYYLVEGDVEVPIIVFSMEAMNMLQSFMGFQVNINGIILPNFDDEAFLMFVFTGSINDVSMALSDEALVTQMSLMLKAYLESQTYYPGQVLDLPEVHPVVDLTVSYATASPHFNLSTYQISDAITQPTMITLQATLTYGIYQVEIDINLEVIPIDILTIEDFMSTTGGDIEGYTTGVVIFEFFELSNIYVIADATGIIFIASQWVLDIGDEVLVYGQYYFQNNMPFVYRINHEDPILEVKSSGHPMPMTKMNMTLSDFILLGVSNPTDQFKYYELSGVLSKLEFAYFYMLDDGISQVAIYAPTPEGQSKLNSYLGLHVAVSGISMPMGDEQQMLIIYLALADDISLYGTDEEVYTEISSNMIDDYAGISFRQGVYHQLPKGAPGVYTFIYEKAANGAYIDLTTGYISNDITEEMWIEIQVTLTVQTYTDTFTIYIHVIPTESITIAQFFAGEVDTTYQVRGVVVFSQFYSDGGFMIVADHTGYVIIPIDLELNIGDEVIIEGMLDTVMGIKTFKEGTITVIEQIAIKVANPLHFDAITMTEIGLLDPMDTTQWGRPIELTGYVQMTDFDGIYVVDALGGTILVRINTEDFDVMMDLMMFDMLEVSLKGYLLPNMNEEDIDGFTLFVAVGAKPRLIYVTDQEKMDALIILGEYTLQGPMTAKQYLELPDDIYVLGATLVWTQVGGPFVFDAATKYLSQVPMSTMITLRATMTIGDLTEYHDFVFEVIPFEALMIPNYENTAIDGLFPGLIIYKIDYQNDYFGGSYFTVELRFPLPETIGAAHFALEYYDAIDETWKTFMYQDEPLTTWYFNVWAEVWMNSDNFSLTLPSGVYYRLRAVGTEHEMYSNEVYVESSMFNTQFTGWNMDGSMYLTGVMMPKFGFGLEVSVTVFNNDTYEYLENAVVYEWYRVNPYTFEMTRIQDASDPLYVTTFEDVGYYILARIKGDGIQAGGYVQIMSWETVKVFNPARVISYNQNGFFIEFSHLFNPSDLEHMVIYNDAYQTLPIIDIIPTMDPFIYQFVLDLSGTTYASLHLWTDTWFMGRLGSDQHYWDTIAIYF